MIFYSPSCHSRCSCLSFGKKVGKYFFFEENIPDFVFHIVDFNGSQQVEGPNCNFNAASKGSTLSQLRNKGLI